MDARPAMRLDIKVQMMSPNPLLRARRWQRLGQERAPAGLARTLHFKDAATLFQSLTPRRLEALDVIYQKGPISVRGLSIAARRDYKNIYGDVHVLERAGLVSRTKDRKLTVPWCWIELRSGLRARGPASRRPRKSYATKSASR
jgi:hypothetical protein